MHKIKQDQRWVRRRLRSAALTAQEPLPRFQTQTSSCTRTHGVQARPGFEEGSTYAGVTIHAPKVEMPELATSGKALRVGLGHAGMSPPI